jgi:predicted ATPase
MLQAIRIQNFRGIAAGTLRNLSPLSILSGSNNSGKSTILDAAYVALSPDNSNASYLVAHRKTPRSDLAYRYLTPFGKPMSGQITCDVAGATVTLSFKTVKENSSTAFQFEKDVTEGGAGWSLPSVQLLTPDLAAAGAENLSAEASLKRVADTGSSAVERLEGLVRQAYAPVSRILTLAEPGQPNYVGLVVATGTIPIHVAGDGLQRLFRIACFAATLPDGLLLLEEPECYLHPASLRLLAKILVQAAQQTQIIMSTHSIELIDRILEAAHGSASSNIVSVHTTRLVDGQFSSALIRGDDAESARDAVGLELR